MKLKRKRKTLCDVWQRNLERPDPTPAPSLDWIRILADADDIERMNREW